MIYSKIILTIQKEPLDFGIDYSSKSKLTKYKQWLPVLEIHQGPVVQSIVSLTKLLVNDSLSLLVRLKSSVLIFFAEKM